MDIVSAFRIVSTQPDQAQAAAYQASAVASLREINVGQVSYSATCAVGQYATDLADLARAPTFGGSAFISGDLARNGALKSGYVFAMGRSADSGTQASTIATCNALTATIATAYQASSSPVDPTTGHYFATDQRGTIYMSRGGIDNPIPAGTEEFSAARSRVIATGVGGGH